MAAEKKDPPAQDTKPEKPREPATILKREIVDKCPCGEEVLFWHRQELVYDFETGKWYRMCEACIQKDCCFEPPAVPVEAEIPVRSNLLIFPAQNTKRPVR